MECGTPQGLPLSLVLYMLYLSKLSSQGDKLWFSYADDINVYRASHSLESNMEVLAEDMALITACSTEHRIAFVPKKMELVHLTRKHHRQAPPVLVNETLTIKPTTTTEKLGQQPTTIHWLEVWFDQKLPFTCHVQEHTGKARKFTQHIHNLAHKMDSPPAVSLQKALITCVLPPALYRTEAWYRGRKKPAHIR